MRNHVFIHTHVVGVFVGWIAQRLDLVAWAGTRLGWDVISMMDTGTIDAAWRWWLGSHMNHDEDSVDVVISCLFHEVA